MSINYVGNVDCSSCVFSGLILRRFCREGGSIQLHDEEDRRVSR